jgi:hypothetical protein
MVVSVKKTAAMYMIIITIMSFQKMVLNPDPSSYLVLEFSEEKREHDSDEQPRNSECVNPTQDTHALRPVLKVRTAIDDETGGD